MSNVVLRPVVIEALLATSLFVEKTSRPCRAPHGVFICMNKDRVIVMGTDGRCLVEHSISSEKAYSRFNGADFTFKSIIYISKTSKSILSAIVKGSEVIPFSFDKEEKVIRIDSHKLPIIESGFLQYERSFDNASKGKAPECCILDFNYLKLIDKGLMLKSHGSSSVNIQSGGAVLRGICKAVIVTPIIQIDGHTKRMLIIPITALALKKEEK